MQSRVLNYVYDCFFKKKRKQQKLGVGGGNGWKGYTFIKFFKKADITDNILLESLIS